MMLKAPTPDMAQRLAHNLRRRGQRCTVRGRLVKVTAGDAVTARTVAQRYAALEVTR